MIILGINGPIEGILAFLAFVLFFVLLFYFMALLSKLSNGNVKYKGTTLTDSDTFDNLNEFIFGKEKDTIAKKDHQDEARKSWIAFQKRKKEEELEAYKSQAGICIVCKKHFKFEDMLVSKEMNFKSLGEIQMVCKKDYNVR